MSEPHDPRAWHDVALQKLTAVLGERAGQAMAAAVLSELDLARLETSEDLRRFSHALGSKGGFAAAVGGLLGVHAVIHGEPGAAARAPSRVPPEGVTPSKKL